MFNYEWVHVHHHIFRSVHYQCQCWFKKEWVHHHIVNGYTPHTTSFYTITIKYDVASDVISLKHFVRHLYDELVTYFFSNLQIIFRYLRIIYYSLKVVELARKLLVAAGPLQGQDNKDLRRTIHWHLDQGPKKLNELAAVKVKLPKPMEITDLTICPRDGSVLIVPVSPRECHEKLS